VSNVVSPRMTDFRASGHAVPIDGVDQLVEQMHRGAKPRDSWRIGTEWEKLVVDRTTGRAAPYFGPRGIERVLRELAERFGWEPSDEAGHVIALQRDGASITLEPGGQLELSGAPFATLHDSHRELATHVRELVTVTDGLGLAVLGLGIQPLSTLDEIEWVPKPRYAVMAPYMTRVGTMGHRMMKQTATVQANVDWSDEADAMRKLRVGQGIAPLVNAMFANSTLVEGRPSGWRSFRGHVWTDTDPARCGIQRFAFRDGVGFADYVQWALDVPLYFILRDGKYRTDVTGMPFRRFLEGGVPGERATLDDWSLHLTTLFPEVRLKTFLEIRSADGQPVDRVLALPALVKGLFHEPDCLHAAWDLVKKWSWEDVRELLDAAAADALAARTAGMRVVEYAKELLAIADEGLRRQGVRSSGGRDERIYLEPLRAHVADGVTPADLVAGAWSTRFAESVPRLVDALAVRPVADSP